MIVAASLDRIGPALVLTLVSALMLNWGYLREHDAAATLPPLSIRRPLHTIGLLAASRRWLTGFASETGGWLLFVLSLRLAPLALVQAVSAGGVGILAGLVSGLRPSRLRPRERLGVSLSVAGLALLGVSLQGGAGEGGQAGWPQLILWLAASAGLAVTAVTIGRSRLAGGVAFGIAAGIAFAAGDVATKATVEGDIILVPVMLAYYGAGTLLLQMGFQRGGALVTAGLATLLTNAIPIVAGMTIFHEPLPGGGYRAIRLVAFATVVVSAVALGRPEGGAGAAPGPQDAGRRPEEKPAG